MANIADTPDEWATQIKKIFDALLLQGFTEEQAIKIMCAAFNA